MVRSQIHDLFFVSNQPSCFTYFQGITVIWTAPYLKVLISYVIADLIGEKIHIHIYIYRDLLPSRQSSLTYWYLGVLRSHTLPRDGKCRFQTTGARPADDIFWCPVIFTMHVVPSIFDLPLNSKQEK